MRIIQEKKKKSEKTGEWSSVKSGSWHSWGQIFVKKSKKNRKEIIDLPSKILTVIIPYPHIFLKFYKTLPVYFSLNGDFFPQKKKVNKRKNNVNLKRPSSPTKLALINKRKATHQRWTSRRFSRCAYDLSRTDSLWKWL